ncbi:intercellular adhesion molecule 5-like isoform X2 [Narcine bancroftii]|uniref:intercellular adhesion molecule 5-like isoform X2 n=1 Tax=Narcine bancroftii TaxID=1343680 RepID=UPI0038313C8D
MSFWCRCVSPFMLLLVATMNVDGFEVWVQTSSLAVEFGQALEVTCNTTCKDPKFVVEHKPGINPKRINNDKWITDQFPKVEKWDFTVPCSVICPSENDHHKESKVVVTVYNRDLNISSVPEALEINRQYQLECIGPKVYPKNKLKLTWLKGSEVVQHNFTKEEGFPDEDDRLRNVLNITAKILDDGQQYTCLAEVILGSNTTKQITNYSVNLEIYAFPDSPRILNKNPIEVNQEVTLTCEVLNVHPAEKIGIKWILNGKDQKPSKHRPDDPSLVRETIAWTPQQIGPNEVVCIAYFEGYPSVPQKKDNISIEVYILPDLEIQTPTSYEDLPVNITCSLSNATGDFQLKLKVGSEVLVSARAESMISYMVIPQAEMNRQLYICEAELEFQHQFIRAIKQNSTFNVQYKPRNTVIMVNNKTQSKSPVNIIKGDEFTVSCSSNGNPQVTMDWYIRKSGNQESKLETNSPEVLHVSQATSEHEGIYKCKAMNKHGIAEKEVEIKVIETKSKDQTWRFAFSSGHLQWKVY